MIPPLTWERSSGGTTHPECAHASSKQQATRIPRICATGCECGCRSTASARPSLDLQASIPWTRLQTVSDWTTFEQCSRAKRTLRAIEEEARNNMGEVIVYK